MPYPGDIMHVIVQTYSTHATTDLPCCDCCDCFIIIGECGAGMCEHTRARKWVQCGRYNQLYYCICAMIPIGKAKDGPLYCC